MIPVSASPSPTATPVDDDYEDKEALRSRQLWLGDVPHDMNNEARLKETFSKYGNIDRVSVFPHKSYAFVVFKNVEDAEAAYSALHGKMRIQYAKPAKPSNCLWVGGVDSSVTKEKLEEELKKFGVLKEFKFMRDRNYAIAEYEKLESAVSVVKTLNQKQIGNGELRVDFLRSHSMRRENGPVLDSMRLDERVNLRPNFSTGNTNFIRVDPNIFQSPISQNRYQTPVVQMNSTNEGEKPCKVLWIGYPASLKVNEELLRRAFILFGEIEHIKMIPGRSFCFVQFRNVDEARRAKEGLQGRLFNNPRVQIRFLNNEIGPFQKMTDVRGLLPLPFRQDAPVHPEWVRPRPPLSVYESPNFTNSSNTAMFAPLCQPAQHTRGSLNPVVASNLNGGMASSSDIHNYNFSTYIIGKGAGASVFNASIQDHIQDTRLISSRVLDGSNFMNEDSHLGKRIKLNEPQLPIPCVEESRVGPRLSRGSSEHHQNNEAHVPAPNSRDSYLYGSQNGIGSDGSNLSVSILASKMTDKSQELTMADNTWKWQGLIAKAGTAVCRALSYPVGKGIEASLPGVVNCFARTDLDVLARHFYQAGNFGVISFIPDGDSETQRYQEFLQYLGRKRRAGVAKLDDENTLFLVPPEFSVNVLRLHGSSLFGVLLKLSHIGTQLSASQLQSSAGVMTVPFKDHPLMSISENLSMNPGVVSSAPAPSIHSQISTFKAVPVSGPESGDEVSSVGQGIQESTKHVFKDSHSITTQGQFDCNSDAFGFIGSPMLSIKNKYVHSQTTIQQKTTIDVNEGSLDGKINPESGGSNEPAQDTDREASKSRQEELNHLVKLLTEEKQPSMDMDHSHLQQPSFLNLGQIPIQSNVAYGLQSTWNSSVNQHGCPLVLHKGSTGSEDEKQKRFQATLQLAAALLQSIHKPEESTQQK